MNPLDLARNQIQNYRSQSNLQEKTKYLNLIINI